MPVENHSGSGEWETLCFDFSGTPAGIPTNSITFIYDNGVNGDAGNDPDAWTFYMDDIEQGSVYGYGYWTPAPWIDVTAGLSFTVDYEDQISDGRDFSLNRALPKIGVEIRPTPTLTLPSR